MIKITIIGNSVALRVRPPEKEIYQSNSVYSVLLGKNKINQENIEVVNLAKSRYLTSEFMFDRDIFIRTFPDYYIINLGCVDAPSREIPLWFSDILFMRKFRNLYKIVSKIHNKIIKPYLRRSLVFIRFKKPWVSAKAFKINFSVILNTLLKETNAKIIVIGINKGNKRIEEQLPGTLKRYKTYNDIIGKTVKDRSRIFFIDVSDLNSKEYFPDGVHYNMKGHKLIENKILSIIQRTL